ncbi:hypothetical protein NL676_039880 [Syzygium grande]|nr:hypothetical protein NL676_039880 [Syzygium grande]
MDAVDSVVDPLRSSPRTASALSSAATSPTAKSLVIHLLSSTAGEYHKNASSFPELPCPRGLKLEKDIHILNSQEGIEVSMALNLVQGRLGLAELARDLPKLGCGNSDGGSFRAECRITLLEK